MKERLTQYPFIKIVSEAENGYTFDIEGVPFQITIGEQLILEDNTGKEQWAGKHASPIGIFRNEKELFAFLDGVKFGSTFGFGNL